MVWVGVDIVEVKRVGRAIERWGSRFLDRVFTPGEIAYCRGKAREVESFAVRYAAKEAFTKALKVGKASIWREVEIVRSEGPRPALLLHGGAREMVGPRRVELALSHAATHAVAVVLIED
jgi:holo-[acyl-carrier protein] synthase